MTQSQTQPAPQNKFAALDQKVSDSRENEKTTLQAQQASPDKDGNDASDKAAPPAANSPADKPGETKPASPAPQQGNKPSNS